MKNTLRLKVKNNYQENEKIEENEQVPSFKEMAKEAKAVFLVANRKKNRVFLGALFMLSLTPQLASTFNFFNTVELKLNLATMSQISLAMSIAYFFSILMISFVFKEHSFKKFFLTSGFISAFMNFSLLFIILKGYHLIGVSPLVCCFVLFSIGTFFQELNLLPLLGGCCRLYPDELQGSAYSVFTSYFNMATCLASLFAGLMLHILNITIKSHGKLWLLLVFQVGYQTGILYWLVRIEFPKTPVPEVNENADNTSTTIAQDKDTLTVRKRSEETVPEISQEKVKES